MRPDRKAFPSVNHRAAPTPYRRAHSPRERGRLCALAAAALVVALLPACSARQAGVVEVTDPTSQSAAAARSDSSEGSGPTSTLAGLRSISEGTRGQEVRVGELVVMLEELGEGPLGDIQNGPALNPKPWTERLSARLVVRNAGISPVPIVLRSNSPEVKDATGHLRPALESDAHIDPRGLVRDDSGDNDFDRLGPGGQVTIAQAYEIRSDDHERPMYLSLRVTPEELVRFRLW